MAGLPATGVIDADGHVLEPANLWEEYLEARFRERAIRIRENAQGLDVLQVAGEDFPYMAPGSVGRFGAMGDEELLTGPPRPYAEAMPFGAGDPGERIALCDRQNLERALLYPTLAIIWESRVTDPELSDAYTRAYNRWIADFCRDSRGRLVPIAHLSLADPGLAVRELERAVKDGCRGAFVASFTATRTPHGHPDHDRVWEAAQSLGVPVAIHPTFEPPDAGVVTRFRGFRGLDSPVPSPTDIWLINMTVHQGMQQAFASFFAHGTLERFPRLTLGVLESTAGWIGTFLDRMDALHEVPMGRATQLPKRPSEYFRRQCFISCDPDETAAPRIIEHVGQDRFVWATDFPHPDHPADWPEKLERFLEPLSESARAAVLGRNAAALYGLA